jgi:hypothetical protein
VADLHPLLGALADYYTPDPDTVSQIDKNGVLLDYVGHAEITRILIEIDPEWTWEPVAWDGGRPATHLQLGKMKKRDGTTIEIPTVSMWGRLTLLGVTRPAVGSVEAHKADLDKELVSDFLRNAAMRFGISLALWAKGPAPQRRTTTDAPSNPAPSGDGPSDAQIKLLRTLKYDGDPRALSKREASAMIDKLKTEHPF